MTLSSRDKILDLIIKLAALANVERNDSVHQASEARKKARELVQKHRVTLTELMTFQTLNDLPSVISRPRGVSPLETIRRRMSAEYVYPTSGNVAHIHIEYVHF